MKKSKIKRIDLDKFVPRSSRKGEVPGTPTFVGKIKKQESTIEVLSYDESSATLYEPRSMEELKSILKGDEIKWIRVIGISDEEKMNSLANLFKLHSIDMTSILNTTQRPHMEERDEYVLMLMKLILIDVPNSEVIIEQVSIVIGENYVITFHESDPTIFDSLKLRIVNAKGRIRRLKSDFLAFSIADIAMEQYFILLETIGEILSKVEEGLETNSDQTNQENIYKLKRRLAYVERTLWPVREMMNELDRSEHKVLTPDTQLFFHSLYDHTLQILESLGSMKDLTSSMMDMYLSTVSLKMNETMKVLTIFSAIFIPLTFLAGVYGMNFDNLPELHWQNGYLLFWIVSITITISMLLFLKRKKWL